jgi:GNAT superfamily N-acetyltransferase
MMEDVSVIRPAIKDFEGVYRLLKQLWPDGKLDKQKLKRVYVRTLKDRDYGIFTAQRDGKIVGIISFMLVNSLWQPEIMCVVNELVVDSTNRSAGIGSKLMETVVKIARREKCVRVELDSAFFRKGAHKFYEKKGFEKRAFLFSKVL